MKVDADTQAPATSKGPDACAVPQTLESSGQALLEGIESKFSALEEEVASGLCKSELAEQHRLAEVWRAMRRWR